MWFRAYYCNPNAPPETVPPSLIGCSVFVRKVVLAGRTLYLVYDGGARVLRHDEEAAKSLLKTYRRPDGALSVPDRAEQAVITLRYQQSLARPRRDEKPVKRRRPQRRRIRTQ